MFRRCCDLIAAKKSKVLSPTRPAARRGFLRLEEFMSDLKSDPRVDPAAGAVHKYGCDRCGLPNHGGKGCPKRPRASGRKKPLKVIGVDCETNSAGIVLFLAAGEDRCASYLYDAVGLDVERVFGWMLDTLAGARAFGYYFDYDVNQLVAQLPPIHQGQLAVAGRVTWRQWKIRHIPSKRFTLSDGRRTVTIWDPSSWAQTSFVKLAESWRLGSPEERATVAAMKARRGDFDDAGEGELVRYTTLECSLLAEWVRRILELHADCGIQLRAYSGPGSTASAMVRAVGWKPPVVPDDVAAIAESAFFGGRSEISRIGPVAGRVYGYDINSAYPAAIAALPEIRGARWRRAREYDAAAWGFWKVQWQQPRASCWGLFPVRGALLPTGRRSLSLLYPTEGIGWFHSSEVAAALAVAPECVEVVEGRVFEPAGEPFAWVRDTAARRMQYKATGDERAFPLKVGLNSVYGKLAQHSGAAPLQCITYAAAVTAVTRGALLRAAYAHGHDVFLLATDGILSSAPLDVPLGTTLGTWEAEEYDGAWMLQAGVYWAGSKKRTRGIDARTLELDDVDTLWRRRGTAGVLKLPSRRVMGYRLAAAQGKLDRTGQWYDSERAVKLSPNPRRRSYRRHDGAMLTIPAVVADYREQARLDALALALDSAPILYEDDAQPDWSYE